MSEVDTLSRTKRPSGENHIVTAMALAAIAAIAIGVGLTGIDPLFYAGAGLFGIASFCWLIGQIQKALYFLPGREERDAMPLPSEPRW